MELAKKEEKVWKLYLEDHSDEDSDAVSREEFEKIVNYFNSTGSRGKKHFRWCFTDESNVHQSGNRDPFEDLEEHADAIQRDWGKEIFDLIGRPDMDTHQLFLDILAAYDMR